LRKVVFAGGKHKSFADGSHGLRELAELEFKPVRVAELTLQAGREMKEQQAAQVEAFHRRDAKRPLLAPRPTPESAPPNAPRVGVVEMDGGRIRTRDENGPRGVQNPHWREFQAGCVVRLQSEVSTEDPRPEVPRLFLNRPKVHKLVTQLHRQRQGKHPEDPEEESIGQVLAEEQLVENAGQNALASSMDGEGGTPPQPQNSQDQHQQKQGQRRSRGPQRLMRTCVATLQGADACGRTLAAEAAARGLDQADRKAFVADGQACNWKIWKRYFQRQGYVPIADLIHLLSYVYGVAMSVGDHPDHAWQLHVQWITAIWQGRAAQVLQDWRQLAKEHQLAPRRLADNHPLRPLQRGLSYLANNLSRTDYPRYRRLGLPITSTLMESLVKEFNLRVKGTEKFWNDPQGAEAILTVRAALLSEDGRFDAFFANRPGCRYRRRSTMTRLLAAQALAI
jgi:hypothetical protein